MSDDKLKYRQDTDLAFLQHCDQADLDILVTYLTKTKKGRRRVTQTLTKEPRFKEFYPDHAKYWDLIAAELQHFGANTLVTLFRGKGVLYRTILVEVCSRLKVNFNKKSSVEVIEMNLLMKILIESLDKMDSEDLKKIIEDLHLKTTKFTKEAVIAALQAAMRAGGFATYRIALIVANAVAKALLNRGLSLGANAALARAIGIFAGPIGWVLTGIWTAVDIAAPAFRVTIPAVIHVAYMRAKSKGA
jgi:uncharacterized protein YaaW (UPF0174 family)